MTYCCYGVAVANSIVDTDTPRVSAIPSSAIPSTLKVYHQFTGSVHVNPNPKNFNDRDELLNITFQTQCVQLENT
jgi:hypothetical protein